MTHSSEARNPERGRAGLRCAVGIWNGSRAGARGQLLVRAVLEDARSGGVGGCTVCGSIEGGQADRLFRSVESEVASNELPVWMELVDDEPVIRGWLPRLRKQLGPHGIVVVERIVRWNAQRLASDAPEAGPTGPAQGLHVQLYTLESRRVNGKPVYQAVAEFLRRRRVLWMSASRGVCGFGEQRSLHAPRGWFSRDDAPVVMHVVDRADVLSACLPELARLVGQEALIVSTPVELYHDPSGDSSGDPSGG